jgi:beta-lactamase class D
VTSPGTPRRRPGRGTAGPALAAVLLAATALLAATVLLAPPAAAQAAAPAAQPEPGAGKATSPGTATTPGTAPAPHNERDARKLAGLATRLDAAEATLVVEDGTGGALRLHPERAAERLPPCSTFKIPNSLIALTAGAVSRNNNRIAWNPERDPKQEWWPEGWDQDQDMPSALRRSAVWYYRELARRIGAERMQAQLDRMDYGNRDISGGIDRFWLSSSLTISADEQVDFLGRLATGGLGFLPEHERYVADALVMERGTEPGGAWRLVAKTGSCTLAGDPARWVGWLVGWIERPGGTGKAAGAGAHPTVFAFNTRGASYAEIRDERSELAVAALRELGFLPTEPAPAVEP